MAMTWYGVKTLFRSRALGRLAATDGRFDPRVDLVEERVVLFRARSFETAILKAEVEAGRYANRRHRNPYGQEVVTEFLGASDAFELIEAPDQEAEVFSTTILVSNRITRSALIERWFGPEERVPDPRRAKFFHAEFNDHVDATPNQRVKPTAARVSGTVRPRGRRGLRASR
jgi:hypothetical protein